MNRPLVQTALAAFLTGIILAPFFISFVRSRSFGQQIREEGPRRL